MPRICSSDLMVSIQTKYRRERIELVKSMLCSLIDLTQLKKKDLEKIPFTKLKQIAKNLEEIQKNLI